MPRKEYDARYCPAPKIVQDFCLEELYPQYLFRYMTPRQPPDNGDKDVELCRLVLTVSPSDFVLQLDGDRRLSDRISADLSALYGSEQRRDFSMIDDLLHPGVPVAARYFVSDDLRWYRAIIVDVDRTPGKQKPVRIRFVDYGNYQQNDPIELKLMPPDMGNEPPMAIKGRLKGTMENDGFDSPIIEQFQNWSHRILKDLKCLVNFCYFDAAANQYVARLFNAENGEEFTLPAGSRRPAVAQLSAPGTSGAAATDENILIEFDDDQGGSSVDLLRPVPPSTAAPSAPVKPSPFEEELKTIFEGISLNVVAANEAAVNGVADADAAINGIAASGMTSNGIANGMHGAEQSPADSDDNEPRPPGEDKVAQTDISLTSRAERAEQAAGDSEQYDPFTDPRYKSLMDKYPNLMKYLKG